MRKQDALMFGLYLVAIAEGARMSDTLGIIQVTLCSALFAFRAYVLVNRAARRSSP